MEALQRIEVQKGDITKLEIDAIVNAANSSLMGGGGVDGAIHQAGGPAIVEQCRKIVASQGYCKTGQAVITTGGNLPARFVIHTVGPVWQGGRECEQVKLANCYKNSLQLAVENQVKTIAFSCISTGVYRFPKEPAARIALDAIVDFLTSDSTIEKVYLVCFGNEDFDLLTRAYNDKINTIHA